MRFALSALHFQLLCLQLCHCILVLMCMFTGLTLILQRVFAKALCCIELLQTLFAEHFGIFARGFKCAKGAGREAQGRAGPRRPGGMRIERTACAGALLLLLPCGRVPALARAALAGHRIAGRRVQFSSSSESVRAGSSAALLLPALAGDTPLWPTGDCGPTGDCADGLKAKNRVIVFHFLVA